ncbi:hypothetical protein [Thermosulfurimonas dismutans]|uniref:Uncharacterized protein n=1 Tax=Thermosulfurimonas dismutans TaxID=999894 RepID=A0A179D446_9BACT|nr:hypothetical protein [Thermosulfurimonas dismutans]OAQ20398.1 hypothetical protein TDIS_1442 [Thermosulfurimonas dismutans]
MKIFWDPNAPLDFTPGRKTGKVEKNFEVYFREALSRNEASREDFSQAVALVEEMLPLLDRLSEDPISRSQAETLADILSERARQLDELLSHLPEGPLRRTLSEAAILFGVEAEKLRRGFYI